MKPRKLSLLAALLIFSCGPDSRQAITVRVNEAIANKNYLQAIEILDKARRGTEDQSWRAELLLRTGEIYQAYLGDPDRAAEYFRESFRTDLTGPAASQARQRLAELLEFDLKDYPSAVLLWGELAEKFRGERVGMSSLLALGRCYQKMGNLLQARIEYQNLLSSPPPEDLRAEALMAIGNINLALGELPQAKEDYHRARQYAPDPQRRGMAAMGEARVMEALGEIEGAIGLYQNILEKKDYPYPEVVEDRLARLRERLTGEEVDVQ